MTISLKHPEDKHWLLPVTFITVVLLSIDAAFLISDFSGGRQTDTYQVTVDRQSDDALPDSYDEAPAVSDEPSSAVEPAQTDGVFVASKNGRKYHTGDCGYAANIREENLITFASAKEAAANGYAPCGVCLPDG